VQDKIPGLYIHIPFCLGKCPYCSFYSEVNLSSIDAFLNALQKEMGLVRNLFDRYDTVYIGGGTPSVLNPQQLHCLLDNVRNNFTLSPDMEVTLEVNPADLNPLFLESVKSSGINRLNIGIQSFDPTTLRFLGRRHSSRQAVSAIELSRKMGFANLGLDLIYGVPGQKMESWLATLSQALILGPEHLSCYQLTIEKNTPLGVRLQKGEFHLPGEDDQLDFFMKTSAILEKAGYIHYEVSNFAKEEKLTSRHNQKYWNHTPYLGLGPAAHSFSGNQRRWNDPSLSSYIANLAAGKLPVLETETLTLKQLRLEALALGLRTSRGVSLKDFAEQYQYDLLLAKREILTRAEEEGLLAIQDGYLRPTRAGLAVADSLALI